jgi:hypothetical protein
MAMPWQEGLSIVRRFSWFVFSQRAFEWVAFALGPLIGVVVALFAGQETSWDFRNYHWYNGYSLLTLRYGQDILVAHHATYHNPGLDILYFLAGNALPPKLTLALLGALEGLNFSLLYLIARSAFVQFAVASSRLVAITTAAVGFLGGMSFLLIATTYFDNIVSILVLVSLYELLKLRETRPNGGRRAALAHGARAGLFIGAASALKLAIMPFAIGVVAAALAVRSDTRGKIVLLVSLATAASASFLVIGGPWMLHLWHATGNPLFPYFNNIFDSPLLASDTYQPNFVPRSFWPALKFPFLFVADPRGTSDALFADYKVLIAYCVLLFSLPLMWLCRPVERPFTDEHAFRIFVAFSAVSYVLWLAIFAIYRYIVILEMLAPVIVVATVGRWPVSQHLRWAICIGLAIAALAGTTLSFGDRTRPGNKLVEIGVPPIRSPARTLVILTGLQPVGFLIPSFPPEVSFVRIDGFLSSAAAPSLLRSEALARIAAFQGDLFVLYDIGEATRMREALAAAGVSPLEDTCRTITNNLMGSHKWCRLKRRSARAD